MSTIEAHTKTKRAPERSRRVPELRFPEFDGEWSLTKVIDFAPLQRGFDLPFAQIEKGPYPVVFSNGALKTHSEFKAKALEQEMKATDAEIAKYCKELGIETPF